VYKNDGHQENWTKQELGVHISKIGTITITLDLLVIVMVPIFEMQLQLFAMSFLDTRILIRKCSNIPTFSLRGVRWWPEI